MPDSKDGNEKKLGGVEAVADMLGYMGPEERERLLNNVGEKDPELVRKIKALMFTFEDLVFLSERQLQQVLREIPGNRLPLALRGAPDELKERVFSNLSRRAAEILRSEIEEIGPQRMGDVQAARDQIMETAKRLEAQGKIILSKTSNDEDFID